MKAAEKQDPSPFVAAWELNRNLINMEKYDKQMFSV